MPTTLYMHENQLTYPLPENPTIGPMRRQLGERDLHYAFINFTSMLVANRIMFNSRYHQDDFLGAMPRFLGGFPEYRELKTLEEISKKSIVFPIGIEFPEPYPVSPIESESKCPLIIWNQRWEYDKNPEEFFNALYKLAERNIPFELALCGQNFRNAPQEFDLARENLADRVVHYGYASEMQYQQLLKQADVTVSTAYHEFFGISVIEAMAFGTFPILPNKLSYPEILPTEFHGSCFYSNQNELLEKLEWALLNIKTIKKIGLSISHSMRSYHWSNLITQFDDLIEGVVDNH